MPKMIKVAIGDNRNFIVLESEHAPLAAGLMAHARIYKSEGWGSDGQIKPSDAKLSFEFIDSRDLEPLDPRIVEAQAEAERKRKDWYEELNKRTALEKQLSDVKAQLEAIKSVTVCTQVEAEKPAGGEG